MKNICKIKIGCVFLQFCGLTIVCYFLNFYSLEAKAEPAQTERTRYSELKQQANKNTITIVTGGASTTQIQFATDLADVLNTQKSQNKETQSLRVIPVIGEGGSQNALDILYLRGVDMGIVQTDALAYLRGQDPVLYKNIQEKIHYITKLYNSEWHVIANKNIEKLSDLKGKTINVSKKFSGTYIASKTIFELLGIKINYVTHDDNIALKLLQNGEIDAVAILAGVPVTQIQNIPADSGLHFVPVDFFFQPAHKVPFKFVLEHFYLPTKLQASTYPNLIPEGKKVGTIASSTILAVYNWPKGSARHRKTTNFIKMFFKKFNDFNHPGRHPKWEEVNLSATPPFWQRYKPADEQLKKLFKSKTRVKN